MTKTDNRVTRYWTKRAKDFGLVRKNELADAISSRWLAELAQYLPQDRPLSILDAGCGTGYFTILLAGKGHAVTGIDLTEAMLAEAGVQAAEAGISADFLLMNAQETDLPSESFDAVVTRNLTWTLPDPAAAYREWYRLLKPAGILLNFDADYAANVRNENQKESYVDPSAAYGHIGITEALSRENAEITLSMPAGYHHRPIWDLLLLERAGFTSFGTDLSAGRRILRERDLSDAPLFLIRARK